MATLQNASNHAGAGTAGACGRGNSKTSSESAAVGGNKLPWNIVVNRLGVQDPGIERNKEARNTHSTSERVQVKGARCVWGTVKVTTSAVVKTTIQRLSTVGESVSVKRK